MTNETLDTTNKCLVAARGDGIIVMAPMRLMSKADAVMFAAWLLAISGKSLEDFETAYEAVCNT